MRQGIGGRHLALGVAVAAVAAVALGGLGQGSPATSSAAELPPGCDPSRPAIAYHGGASAPLSPQPAGGPIGCGMPTGMRGRESRLAVMNSGTVVYNQGTSPDGSVNGLAVSKDNGATWQLSGKGGGLDTDVYVDRDTGRLFFIKFQTGVPPNREIDFSDDGLTWTTSSVCCIEAENSRVVTAKPRTSTTVGYPNVVYVCSNTSLLGGLAFPAGARMCSKSLDGGRTYSVIGLLFTKTVPQHQECAPHGEYFGASDGLYPQAAPNGSLYVLVNCGIGEPFKTYLARSDDEGRTWPILREIPFGNELRVDEQGNLYLGSTGLDDAPRLRVSRDEGRTWGRELNIGPPGITVAGPHPEAGYPYWPDEFTSYSWFMAIRRPGQVAFAFQAQRTGDTRWDAYIAETRNALDANPTFWAAPVTPLAVDITQAATNGRGRAQDVGFEHLGIDIAPDGSPWGSFTTGVNGVAGRLYWPGGYGSAAGAGAAAAAGTSGGGGGGGGTAATGGWGVVGVLGLLIAGTVLLVRRSLRRAA